MSGVHLRIACGWETTDCQVKRLQHYYYLPLFCTCRDVRWHKSAHVTEDNTSSRDTQKFAVLDHLMTPVWTDEVTFLQNGFIHLHTATSWRRNCDCNTRMNWVREKNSAISSANPRLDLYSACMETILCKMAAAGTTKVCNGWPTCCILTFLGWVARNLGSVEKLQV
jgi:hypothetical protein